MTAMPWAQPYCYSLPEQRVRRINKNETSAMLGSHFATQTKLFGSAGILESLHTKRISSTAVIGAAPGI